MAGPGYLLVVGHALDREKMMRYSAALPPIYQDHGGGYLGIGGPGRGVECLQGAWTGHSVVLARFPSRAAVNAFWNSAAYAQAKQLRVGAGNFQVFAMEGIAEPPQGAAAYLAILDAAGDQPPLAGAKLTKLAQAKAAQIDRLEGEGAFDVMLFAAPSLEDARAAGTAPARPSANTFLVAALPR